MKLKMKAVLSIIIASCAVSSSLAWAQADSARKIEMMCDRTKVEIVCGRNDKLSESYNDHHICVNNELIFTLPDGAVVKPPVPKLHELNSTPVDFACVTGSDRKFYITTTYLSNSYSCGKCRISEVYDAQGLRMHDKSVAAFYADQKIYNWSQIRIEEVPLTPDPSLPNEDEISVDNK